MVLALEQMRKPQKISVPVSSSKWTVKSLRSHETKTLKQ